VSALRLALRSVTSTAITVVTLGTLVFLAGRALPSDPAALLLGDQASPAERAVVMHALRLDRPLHVQYMYFLRGLTHLDFGESLRRPGTSALSRALGALVPTAELALTAVCLSTVLGVLLGLLVQGPWLGRGRVWLSAGIDLFAAVPLVAFAPLATYVLCLRLRWIPLPGDPESRALGLLFAAGLLALPLGLQLSRFARALLAGSEGSQYLQVARSKGASESRTLLLHALPPVSGPLTVIVATQFGALLGGAAVLEKLFERRGLGTLLIEAYGARDLPVLEASVVLSGVLFALVQGLGTIASAVLDPRVRS
jgi:peptide/nickel transport system permease protein